MATITRRPTSDYSCTFTPKTGTTHYWLVYDSVMDSDASYNWVTTGGLSSYTDLFNFTAFDVPSGSTISSVRIYYAVKGATLPVNTYAVIKVGGSTYSSSVTGASASYVTYYKEWTTNPKTGASWTVNDVNGIGANALEAFGYKTQTIYGEVRFTQVYAYVTYATSATVVVDSLITSVNSVLTSTTKTGFTKIVDTNTALSSLFSPIIQGENSILVQNVDACQFSLLDGWKLIANDILAQDLSTCAFSIEDIIPLGGARIEPATLNCEFTQPEITNSYRVENEMIMTPSIEYDVYTPVEQSYDFYGRFEYVAAVTESYDLNGDVRFTAKESSDIDGDIRWNLSDWATKELNPVTDITVWLDGVQLEDIDLDSLTWTLNLGVTPSEARFRLIRRHDKYNYTLDNVYSRIDNENEIKIYDNTVLDSAGVLDSGTLLFTGNITQINADSKNDLVEVLVQDGRYKLGKTYYSDVFYYGWYAPDDPLRLVDLKTIHGTNWDVLYVVFAAAISAGIITGYETAISSITSVGFEGSQINSNYADIIERLLKEIGNIDWYLDENKYIRFINRSQGDIRTLKLADLTGRRHIYDVITDDIQLNKATSNYATGYTLNFQKERRIHYWLETINMISGDAGTDNRIMATYLAFNTRCEKAEFRCSWFKYAGLVPEPISVYDGMNLLTLTAAVASGAAGLWYYNWAYFQVKTLDNYYLYQDASIGSSGVIKVFSVPYGGVNTQGQTHWEELTYYGNVLASYVEATVPPDQLDDRNYSTWLCRVTDGRYDLRYFGYEYAWLNLSRCNALQTEATVSLFLDAFEYYNVSFKNRINIDNTIQSGIYKDNNGFPLNINNITFTAKDRTVSMKLTNYGGTFYRRTLSYNNGMIYRRVEKYLQKYERFGGIIFVDNP